MGGRPGAFLHRQIQHIPLQSVKGKKTFIVHEAKEKRPFRLHYGGGAGYPSRISERTKCPRVLIQFDSLAEL